MNRVELDSNPAGMPLRQLGQAIRAGKAAALSRDEYVRLVRLLQSKATAMDARRNLLILALMDKGADEGLLQYCATLIAQTTQAPGCSGYEGGTNLALQLLLAKSPDAKSWVSRFERSPCAVLRMAVAEHLFDSDPQRALLMMIDIIPLAGTDHSVTDSIDLWLANEANAQLLAAVESRLDALTRTEINTKLIDAYRHARQVISNA